MYDKAHVRMFVHGRPVAPPFAPWVVLGAVYLRAAREAGVAVQAVCTHGMISMQDPNWPYANMADAFLAKKLPESYLNVIVGSPHDWGSFYVEGQTNIAITACIPNPPNEHELKALRHFDVVGAIDDGAKRDLAPLIRADWRAQLIRMLPEDLGGLLHHFIEFRRIA